MSKTRAGEVWKEIKPFAVRDLIKETNKTSGGETGDYSILLYRAATQKISKYSYTITGLHAALEAASSGDLVFVPAGTITPGGAAVSFVSTVGAEKCLWVDVGGSVPSNWEKVSFDDSAWSNSVASSSPLDGIITISGASMVTQADGDLADESTMYFRRTFTLSEIPISCEIEIAADDYVEEVYINDTLVFSGGDRTTKDTFYINPNLLETGNNLLSVKISNWTYDLANYMCLMYKITMASGEITVPAGVELVGMGKNSVIDGVASNNGKITNITLSGVITGSGEYLYYDSSGLLVTNKQLESDVATGTAPFVIDSETLIDNLNADLLDGKDAADLLDKATYDADDDGLVDTASGGTELDTSASDGIPHLSSGTWSILKRLSPGADTELTIATGAVTVTQLYHRVDTELDAASDELDTINGLANDGELLILHPENDARDIVLKHGTGNIYIPGGSDITLDDSSYHVLLIYDAESANWCVVGGGGGGGVSDAADLTYTPLVNTDWNGDIDPGNADDALDQLAERVDDNEIEIATKANDNAVVHDTGDETIAGVKTFSSFPVTPSSNPTTDYQTANKKYVDDKILAHSDPVFHVEGALSVATDVNGSFVCPRNATIEYVYIYCKTTGSAGSTIVDVNKNGTTIFTTQANRPELAYNDADGVAKSGAPDITSLVENDVLTIDIDQIATGAEDLTVIIAMIIGGGGPAGGADILEVQVFS